MPAGLPKVDINFLLNADGILTIQAIELRSGVKQQVDIKPTYGLKDEEVEQMLLDAVTHAKDDVAQRMIIEARTEGEQMVYTVERFLNKNGSFLNEEETLKTLALIAQLKETLAGNQKDAILNAIDALNEYTRPFAERLMDVAVSQAMKGKEI
jgi:molecular chaperone DnaK (HSP70)